MDPRPTAGIGGGGHHQRFGTSGFEQFHDLCPVLPQAQPSDRLPLQQWAFVHLPFVPRPFGLTHPALEFQPPQTSSPSAFLLAVALAIAPTGWSPLSPRRRERERERGLVRPRLVLLVARAASARIDGAARDDALVLGLNT